MRLVVALKVAAALPVSVALASETPATATETATESSAPAPSVLLSGVALGFASFKGDGGPWLEVFLGHDFRLGKRFVLRLEGSFLYSSYSHDSSYQEINGTEVIDVESVDDAWTVGGHLRPLITYEFSRAWAARVGVLLGFASVSMTSDHCSDFSLSNPYHGLSAGPLLRLGAERRFELALDVDFMAYPKLYCAGTDPPEVHKRDELSYDDPTLVFNGRFAYHF
jgi:hypothetical protein